MRERQPMYGLPEITRITAWLGELSVDQLQGVIDSRLHRRPFPPLPGLTGDKDPTDIFIECFDRYPQALPYLQIVTGGLLNQWEKRDDEGIKTDPEPLGELLYLGSAIEARSSVPTIAIIAGRDGLALAVLAGGEDIQGQALRSLAGLLIPGSPEERFTYRPLFEAALASSSHAPIGLGALSTFWPAEKETFINQALKYPQTEQINWVVGNLDVVVRAFRQK